MFCKLLVMTILAAAVCPFCGTEVFCQREHPADTSRDGSIAIDTTGLDAFIQLTMNSTRIPGVSACIVKNGCVAWKGFYGYANIDQKIRVSDSTLFMLASVSKTVTGLALMKLWERWMVDLDDDVNTYIPFWIVNPLYPDAVITPRMLLTHTSSLNDNWSVMYSTYVEGDTPFPLEQYVYAYFVPGGAYYSESANFNSWQPGSKWEYCNHGFVLAGYLVQAISGVPFNRYCVDSIFRPAGMNQSSFFLRDLDTHNVAMPYHHDGNRFVPLGHFGYADYPAGTLRSSAGQLARHLLVHLNNGEIDGVRIVDSATIREITTLQCPALSSSQGVTWFYSRIGQRYVWEHGGGDQGVRTRIGFCPSEKTGVVVLTNGESESGVSQIVNRLWDVASTLTNVGGISVSRTLPEEIKLFQNYPNPFNPVTVISFALPERFSVTLDIFNMLGQEVARLLVDAEKEAGYTDVEFDAGNLPSGVYICRLRAGTTTLSKKMMVSH